MKKKSYLIIVLIISQVLSVYSQKFGELHQLTSGKLPGVDIIHTADLDNDGNMEILATEWLGRYIYIFDNKGNNEYSDFTTTNTGYKEINKLATCDVNNDGLQDIVFSRYSNSSQIMWMQNMGDNHFENSQIIFEVDLSTQTYTDLLIKDINNDGFEDIIFILNASGYALEILINKGDGTFEHDASLINEGTAYVFQCMDFDSDGDYDIIYKAKNPFKLTIAINNGYGEFFEEIVIVDDPDSKILNFHVFDTDNDNDMDIMGWTYQDSVILYLNNGENDFSLFNEISNSQFNFKQISSIDLDDDGDYDLLNSYLDIFENTGNNSFQFIENTKLPNRLNDYKLTNLNNNEKKDLVFGMYSTASVGYIEDISIDNINKWKNITSQIYNLTFPACGIINDDEFPDICILDDDLKYVFYLNNGNGEFLDTITTPLLHRYSEGTAYDDFNNDGFCDIISYSDYEGHYFNDSSNFKFAKNNGNNTFSTIYFNDYNNLNNYHTFFTDMDSDGRKEVFLFNSTYKIDTILILKINSDFSLSNYKSISLNIPVPIERIRISDLDYNGENDIIINARNSIMVNYSLNGEFGDDFEPIILSSDLIYDFVIANINNDPAHDILIAIGEYISIYEDFNGDVFETTTDLLVPGSTYNLYSLDSDNDNIDDIFCLSDNDIGILSSIGDNSYSFESHNYKNNSQLLELYSPFLFSDIDVDGDLDLVCTDKNNSDISWLENNFIHASVKENETHNSLLVYPNPAGESINIKLEEPGTQDYEILLYNNLGMEISHFQAEANQTQMSINTKNLKAGVYYVVLKSGNNISTSKVLIVK